MNKQLSTLVLSMMILSASAFAAEEKSHPCQKLRAACEAGGYYKGGHKKGSKGLYKDCMASLKAGKSVEGVNADPADISACQAKKAAKAAKQAK